MSAACTLSVVSRLGISREMSMPTSAMAWTTAGLSRSAGCEPAEVTRTLPAPSRSRSAAAIWERPALCVQTKSTSGTSRISEPPWLASELSRSVGTACGAADRVNDNGEERAQSAADDLRPDERCDRARRDPCVGIGEAAADSDGWVGERGRRGEPIRSPDPGANGPGRVLQSAGPGESNNDQEKARGRHDLAKQQRCARSVLMRGSQQRLTEHGIGERSASDGSSDLADDNHGGLADAIAVFSAPAEQPVRCGDHRVELRAARWRE